MISARQCFQLLQEQLGKVSAALEEESASSQDLGQKLLQVDQARKETEQKLEQEASKVC